MEMEMVLNSLWTSGWPGVSSGEYDKVQQSCDYSRNGIYTNLIAVANSPSVSVLGSPDGLASWGGWAGACTHR